MIGQRANRYGHIHHSALRALGLSQRTITARCAAGRLIREHKGVYSVGHAQRTPAATADAAVMACDARAALSHDSAAALWRLRRWPAVPEVSSTVKHLRPGIRAHRTPTLKRSDVTYRHGIRVTTIARTIADIARRLTDLQLTRAIHEGRRNGDLTDAGIARLLEICSRAQSVFNPAEAPSRNVFPHVLEAFLIRHHLPVPTFEARRHGVQLDALYDRHRLIIELDGHRDHSLPDRFEEDRRRDALALERGYVTLRITCKRLNEHPTALAGQLRAILAARTPAGG